MFDLTATKAVVRCKPLGDRVLIKPDPEVETSRGGVHLPDTIQERESPKEGIVVAIGDGKWDQGARVPMQVQLGDRVRYSRNAGSDFLVGDEEYLVVHERDIFAVLYVE